MDARRYDRNADQLSQIFWHYTRLQREKQPNPHPQIEDMLRLLQSCLQINDELGQMAEKGLI
jgi:uncharacterized membrane protein YccC